LPSVKELIDDPRFVRRIPVTIEDEGLSWSADILQLDRDGAFIETDRRLRSGSVVQLRFRRPRDWSIVKLTAVVERVLQSTDAAPTARTPAPRVLVAFTEPLHLADVAS